MRINKTARIIILICIILLVLSRVYIYYNRSNSNNAGAQQTFNRHTNRLILTKHARCRMQCRAITREEINEILQYGNVNYNESNLNEPRGPRYALEGYSHEHQHLRVIFVPEPDAMIVVTCIDLDKDWPCPSCN